jgi:hypothetical protein
MMSSSPTCKGKSINTAILIYPKAILASLNTDEYEEYYYYYFIIYLNCKWVSTR